VRFGNFQIQTNAFSLTPTNFKNKNSQAVLFMISHGKVEAFTLSKKSKAPLCAFTVDVEDWFQSSVDFDAPITDRVVRNVHRIVTLLDEFKVKGTFFVQGMVAQKFPRLLQELLENGHDIQSHGHTHRPLSKMDRRALKSELEAAKKSVEDACGVRVTAFRAPDFSIVQENLWALETLAETGFLVDSSIFPKRMARYGVAGWNCFPEKFSLPIGASILEAPVAMWQIGDVRIPVAGGGYFRFLPEYILRCGIESLIQQQQPAIIYCHPYEFNPDELADFRGKAPSRFLFTQGIGRRQFAERMRHLLGTFSFGRFDEVLTHFTA
jgi:polysaccharide deacetylase family protein (PEP-CTERM system associated)